MVLIEREAAKVKSVYCEERHEYVVPVASLDWLPAIDAAPVVHGCWIFHTEHFAPYQRCSVCGFEIPMTASENAIEICLYKH